MTEAPEEKTEPTIDEQQAKLEAELREAAGQQGVVGDAPEPQVSQQVDEKVEIPPPDLSSEGGYKNYLMSLGMPELRDAAKKLDIKIPFNIRSKEAISDFIVAKILESEGEVPEAGEAPATAPEEPEVAGESSAEPEFDYRAAYQGLLASNAMVHQLLDELAGHGPTVRQFQDLSAKIRALLPK